MESYWGSGSVFTWGFLEAEPETGIQMQAVCLGSTGKLVGEWRGEIHLFIHSQILKRNKKNIAIAYFLFFLKLPVHVFFHNKKNQVHIILRKTCVETSKDLKRLKSSN